MYCLYCIYFGSILSLLLAIFHSRFYKRFNWKGELSGVTDIQQRIIYTIHLALTLLFFILGFLSLIYAQELAESTGLAFGFNSFYSLFWLWRLIWQVVYIIRESKKKHIIVYLMNIWFALLFISYAIPVIFRLSQ